MQKRSIQIIANPGAGQEGLNLKTVHAVFSEYSAEWDIRITKQAGDAERLTREAIKAGVDVVAIYGGDGSVAEAAAALAGASTQTCLAILPGGTANVMSIELGVPSALEEALRVAADPSSAIRVIDVGAANERIFVLRVSMGLEAEMVAGADREAKDRYGVFAYLWSAARNAMAPQTARYRLLLDGKEEELEGVTCIVANSGNLGRNGLFLASDIAVDDGFLDVIVIEQAGFKTLLDVAGSVLNAGQPSSDREEARAMEEGPPSAMHRWRVKSVEIISDPPQRIQSDGELLEAGPLRCNILPGALRVLTPAL
jgi:YegS/Rv2252/BmrU family lipid kinase